MSIEVDDMKLSLRTKKLLREHGITNTDELTRHTYADLLSKSGFGAASLSEIEDALYCIGLRLMHKRI